MSQKTISILCATILSIFTLTLSYISRNDFGTLPTLTLFIIGIILAIFVALGIFSRTK